MGVLSNKKVQKREMDVRLVGAAGNQVLYIVWLENGTELPGSLWKLQWPGNTLVDRWSEASIRGSDGELTIDSSERTGNFFNQCLFPVQDPITDLEKRLVEKYGKNESGKLKPETIEPPMWKHWKKLEALFLTGIFSLWFPTLESNPTEEEIQRKAGEEVNRRWIYWKPFVTGLATISEETMHRAHPLELRVIDEVNRLREEYLEHRVIKAELVERK